MPSLKKSSDFQLLKEKGHFQHITAWLAVSSRKNKEKTLRWGFTISKKVGGAVLRNKLRRWGRESLREFESNEIDINFIFKIRGEEFYKELTHDELDRAFKKAFHKVLQSRH